MKQSHVGEASTKSGSQHFGEHIHKKKNRFKKKKKNLMSATKAWFASLVMFFSFAYIVALILGTSLPL